MAPYSPWNANGPVSPEWRENGMDVALVQGRVGGQTGRQPGLNGFESQTRGVDSRRHHPNFTILSEKLYERLYCIRQGMKGQ